MRKHKTHKTLKFAVLLALLIALASLVLSVINRSHLRWLEKEHDLMIELGMFPGDNK
jgi:hypothetical protein